MKLPTLLNLILVVAIWGATTVSAHPSHPSDHERTRAAYALGLGSASNPHDAPGHVSIAKQIDSIRQKLATNPSAREAMRERAARYTFGVVQKPADSTGPKNLIFAEVVAAHLQTLTQNKSAYREVLQRAYQHVVGRDVYSEEVEYWSEHPTLPYALLVGCIEDWARRNQPGLMNTSGTPTISINCELLETARLSPEIAAEAATLVFPQPGATIIAPGGPTLKSVGDIRFVITGVR